MQSITINKGMTPGPTESTHTPYLEPLTHGCKCDTGRKIVGYQYVTRSRFAYVQEYNHVDFVPAFCPFCGAKK